MLCHNILTPILGLRNSVPAIKSGEFECKQAPGVRPRTIGFLQATASSTVGGKPCSSRSQSGAAVTPRRRSTVDFLEMSHVGLGGVLAGGAIAAKRTRGGSRSLDLGTNPFAPEASKKRSSQITPRVGNARNPRTCESAGVRALSTRLPRGTSSGSNPLFRAARLAGRSRPRSQRESVQMRPISGSERLRSLKGSVPSDLARLVRSCPCVSSCESSSQILL